MCLFRQKIPSIGGDLTDYLTIANLFLPFLMRERELMSQSSVTFWPFMEMALPARSFRASPLLLAKPVSARISTNLLPILAVGKDFANSSISELLSLVMSWSLPKRNSVSFSAESAASLPWTPSVTR